MDRGLLHQGGWAGCVGEGGKVEEGRAPRASGRGLGGRQRAKTDNLQTWSLGPRTRPHPPTPHALPCLHPVPNALPLQPHPTRPTPPPPQMTEMLNVLEAYLEDRGIPAARLDGSVPWQQRMTDIADFQVGAVGGGWSGGWRVGAAVAAAALLLLRSTSSLPAARQSHSSCDTTLEGG